MTLSVMASLCRSPTALGTISPKRRIATALVAVDTRPTSCVGQFVSVVASLQEMSEDVMTTAMLVPTSVVPSSRWGSPTKRSTVLAPRRPFSSQCSSLSQFIETSAVSVPAKNAVSRNPAMMRRSITTAPTPPSSEPRAPSARSERSRSSGRRPRRPRA